MMSRAQWEALSAQGNKGDESSGSGVKKSSGRGNSRGHSKKGGRRDSQGKDERGNEPKPKFDKKKKIKCYNCGIYGHLSSECCKPKKNRAYMAEKGDDGPALLMLETCELMETKEETTDVVTLVDRWMLA